MRILENLSTCTMQRINWGLFSRAHCYTWQAQENGKSGNEAFSIHHSTCTQSTVCTHIKSYILCVTFTHNDTFTQSFTALNSQWSSLFTCVVMFSKSNPIKSGGLNPRPSGSFLRVCGLWRTEAWAPSRKLRWHYLLSCVGGRELMIARQQSYYLQHQARVMLPIYTTTLSVFIIHISCGILAWKGVISFMVEGRLWLALRSQGLQQDGLGGMAFVDSKHQNSLHKQGRNISPENVMLGLL